MSYVPGKTHIEAQAWGRGYVALWACFGHKRPRVVYGKDRRAIVYPSKADALEAAAAAVRKHEPTLTGTMPPPLAEDAQEARIAEIVTAQFVEFRERQAREERERSRIFRPGKSSIPVETIRSRRA